MKYFIISAAFIILAIGISSADKSYTWVRPTPVVGSDNVSRGYIYNHTDDGFTVDLTDNVDYFKINNLSSGNINNMAYSDSELTILDEGTYFISWSVAFSGSANNEYQVATLLNGDEIEVTKPVNCETHRVIGSGGDVGSASGNCLVTLEVNDVVSLGIQDADGPIVDDATFYAVDLTVLKTTAGTTTTNGTGSNLTINDSEYLFRNGTKELTGNWEVGDFNISTRKDIKFLTGHGLLWDSGRHGFSCNGVANTCNIFATDEVQVDTDNWDINIDTELKTATTSVEVRTPTWIFAPSAAVEATLIPNRLTFNNGASDTYMEWSTNGITDMHGDWYFIDDVRFDGSILSNSTKLNDVCSWNTPTASSTLVWNSTGNCWAIATLSVASTNYLHSTAENTTDKTYESTTNTHNLTLVTTANSAIYYSQGYIFASGGEPPCRWKIEVKKTGGTVLETTYVSELATNSGFNDYGTNWAIKAIDTSPTINDYYYTTLTELETQCSMTIISADLSYEGA